MMKHLLRSWQSLRGRLSRAHLLLFLDYDGTLTPLRRLPGEAFLPGKTRQVLRRLSRSRQCTLSFVSGRILKDLRAKIGIRNAWYAGNHGLEIAGPGLAPRNVVPRGQRREVRRIIRKLKTNLGGVPGVLIEDKIFSTSLHYRMVAKRDLREVFATFDRIVESAVRSGAVTVQEGKKVREVRPAAGGDKGTVVGWFRARVERRHPARTTIAVYIGDDRADEAAFAALGRRDITVTVGPFPSSRARYYLKDPREVREFLEAVDRELSPGTWSARKKIDERVKV